MRLNLDRTQVATLVRLTWSAKVRADDDSDKDESLRLERLAWALEQTLARHLRKQPRTAA